MLVNLERVVARELGIAPERVTDNLAYQSIREWDSLRHVALIIALEKELGMRIEDESIAELQTISAIRHFVAERENGGPIEVKVPTPRAETTVHRGLENIYFDYSAITYIDGQNGILQYRGYAVADLLANELCFEDVALLLLEGELADPARLQSFRRTLQSDVEIPAPVLHIVETLADAGAHPTAMLQVAVSALGAMGRIDGDHARPDDVLAEGIRLIAQIPRLLGVFHSRRMGRDPILPDRELSYAANLLYVITGEQPAPEIIRIMEDDLILHADHGANASTFTGRVAIGCEAALPAAIAAAIGAFSGALHGGACERVADLIEAVGTPERAESYVRDRLAARLPVMGFGHRVYRTEDPRVRPIRRAALQLALAKQDMHDLDVIDAIVKAMQPFAEHGVGPNVDLYAGVVYRLIGLPADMAVPMFIAARVAGWIAQCLEQMRNNVLIRPRLMYVGPGTRACPPQGGL